LVLGFPKVEERAVEAGALEPAVEAREPAPGHLARELHDLVAQPLLSLVLEINDLRAHAALDAEEAEWISRLEDSVRGVLRNTRELLIDLRGQGEIRLNFREILTNQLIANAAKRDAPIPILQVSSTWPRRINGWAAFNLLRVVQEAVANALRHGRARRVEIILSTSTDGMAVVVIVDDGAGVGDAPSGIGMIGMQERAVILGGKFSVVARNGGGTRVEVRVPLQRLR
jgi:two-component system, NarL family, sensor histidine kinase UhpB